MSGKENTNLHAADSSDSTLPDMPWLVFAVTISGCVLFVLTCGGVEICIYIFDKKKKRRTRSFVKTGKIDSTNNPEFPMNVDTISVLDDHGQVDGHHVACEQPFPERQSAIDSLNVNRLTFAVGQNRTIQQIADNDFDDPMYNTENVENVKSVDGNQVDGLYMYDVVIEQSGELLYENSCLTLSSDQI